MKHRLSTVDWAFLQAESPTNLSHVAGLWVFDLPKAYRKNFWREYMAGLDDATTATPPFNYKLTGGLDLPSWGKILSIFGTSFPLMASGSLPK